MYRPGEKTAYTTFSPDAYALQKGYPWNQEDVGYYLANISAILSLLPQPPAKVLDAGCGVGFTSHMLAMRGYQVTGIDVNTELLTIASENRWQKENSQLEFVEHDFEEEFRPNSMDAVLFHDSLHHSIRPLFALRMAYTSLKRKGLCVAVEPGIGHSMSPHAQKFAKENDVTEVSTPPYKVARLAKRVGFKVKRVYPHFGVLERTIFKTNLNISHPLIRIASKIRFSVFCLMLGKWFNGIIVLQKGD